MLTDSPMLLDYLRTEIIEQDCYRLLGVRDPDVIVDIGANIGVFSLRAREMFPKAAIVAFEPHPQTYAMLCSNVADKGIHTTNVALGDGSRVNFVTGKGGTSGNNQSYPAETGVPSMPLRALLSLAGVTVTSRTYIKVDCEGAEKFLFDEDSTGLLKQAGWLGMEYHWREPRRNTFPHAASFDEFVAWFSRLENPLKIQTAKIARDRGNAWGSR